MKYDIILIQPPLFKSFAISENSKIEYDYWNTMEKYAGRLLGDLPVEPSYGILSIASYLELKGYSVKILDFHIMDYLKRMEHGVELSLTEMIHELEKYSTDFWGLSMMTISEQSCFQIINAVRELFPCSYIFVGGHYPTNNGSYILERNQNIDFVVKNEGEYVVADILDCYNMNGSINFKNLNTVYRKDKYIIDGQCEDGFIYDINQLPIMNYSFYDEKSMDIIVPRVYTARGCENSCVFCTANNASKKIVRKRSPQLVVDEIEYLVQKFNKKFFVIGDLEFLSDIAHSKSICEEIIKRRLNVKWWCQVYPPNIDNEILKLMYDAGCIQVALGIESNNEKSLEILNKNASTNISINACKMVKANGMQVQAYLILGLPNDTVDSILSTITFAGDLICKGYIDVTHLAVMTPYPGSELYNRQDFYNIQITEKNAGKYFMNCDFLGSGIPPYNLREISGAEIYSLWLFGLSHFTKCFQSKMEYTRDFKKIYEDLHITDISILGRYSSMIGAY